MKKQLLLSAGILVSGLLGAQVGKRISKIPAHLANISATKYPQLMEPQSAATTVNNQPKKSVKKATAFTSDVIGTSYYDLQSNSSVGDRIFVNADGSISAVWTMDLVSGDNPAYANRGTGYAYFNGTAWTSAPTTRVEAAKAGWGNIVHTRSGRELILAHSGATGAGLNLASRNAKGTGAWAESTTILPSANTAGNLWPRMVNSGDTIYALSITQNTTTAGAALYQGLNGAVCFSRSRNAGVTWDIVNQIPTGIDDLTRFSGFAADAYAIAAKGATVAVVAGGAGKDVVLSKSTDGGATWTKTTILKFPIAKWNPATTTTDINGDNIPDTLMTNDGTFSVGLDNNAQAYVFYGNTRILQSTPQANGAYSYFPYVDG